MTEEKYDSRDDTLAHIKRVRDNLVKVISRVCARAANHDSSKLMNPEKEVFDKVTPQLKGLTYGSDEYKASLKEMGPALDHHYKHNAHHPEHHPDGIRDMTLIDLLELLADWKSAGERHTDGSMAHSFEVNEKRFEIPEPLLRVLLNTAKDLGWLDVDKHNECN